MRYIPSFEFVEDVSTMLSGSLVDVELNEPDYALAFYLAKRTWQQKGSDNLNLSYLPLTVTPKINAYVLPENVSSVAEVIETKAGFGAMEDPFAMANFQQTFTYGMGGSVSGDYFMIYDMTKQIIENNKMYLAAEPNYRFNPRTHTLQLHNPPRVERNWLLEVYTTPTDLEYEQVLWILQWTVAECKQILGRAYRKMGSLPSPTGETQIDGDQLVQESQQDKERLLEEIDMFTDGDADGMGIFVG